jgi:hypothetical protein
MPLASVGHRMADDEIQESEMQVASTKKEQGTFAKTEPVTFVKKEPPQWLLDMILQKTGCHFSGSCSSAAAAVRHAPGRLDDTDLDDTEMTS